MCLACGANAVVAGIGNGAGVTIANLPCVTAGSSSYFTSNLKSLLSGRSVIFIV